MYEPQLGEVVTLRSNPDRPMTVAAYVIATKMYEVVWLSDDGKANAIALQAAALAKADLGQSVDELRGFIEATTQENNSLRAELGITKRAVERLQSDDELGRIKMDHQAALHAAASLVPGLRSDATLADVLTIITSKYEQMKSDANAQIEAANTKLKAAGLYL